MCKGHLRYGSSSGKEEKVAITDKVLGRVPSPQASSAIPPSLWSASSGSHSPHSAVDNVENRAGSEEECRKVVSRAERKEDPGECEQTVGYPGETGSLSGMWPISSLTGQA